MKWVIGGWDDGSLEVLFFFINKGNLRKVLVNEFCDKSEFIELKLETWIDYVYVDDDIRYIYVVCSWYFYKIICNFLKFSGNSNRIFEFLMG